MLGENRAKNQGKRLLAEGSGEVDLLNEAAKGEGGK